VEGLEELLHLADLDAREAIRRSWPPVEIVPIPYLSSRCTRTRSASTPSIATHMK
jgi:hypothetical protein